MNWLRVGKSQASCSRWRVAIYAALLNCMIFYPNSGSAQDEQAAAPIAEETGAADAVAGGSTLDVEALRVLVAPIALYPDDVLAVVLPASTTGLQIVQAQRYLDKHKADPSAQPNSDWDPSVLALLNYPEVLSRMNADLDWTSRLGDAVINQQADVMDAIQQIRNEAAASGYLKSDEKQVVTQEKETVIIKSADPEVVYVPTYDPQVVVEQTYVTAPPPVYSTPYPYYYSPAATFFTGAFVGAAFAYGFDWDDDDIDIDIDENHNFNSNRNFNSEKYNFRNKPTQHGNKTTWQGANKRPSTLPAGGKRPFGVAPVNRPGANGGGINGGNRPAAATGQAKPALSGQTKANQPKVGQPKAGQNKPANRPGNKPATAKSGSSLGSYTPGRQTAKESNRGQQSLSNQRARSSAPARPNTQVQRPRQGAFGGSSAGGSAVMQQNRGNRSLGGRGGGGARRR
jgi:hypothetical protein